MSFKLSSHLGRILIQLYLAKYIARLLPLSSSRFNLPRPIVLDTNLRLPVDCKLINNFKSGKGRRPWVVGYDTKEAGWNERKIALETAGVKVIEVKSDDGTHSEPWSMKRSSTDPSAPGHISIPDLLRTLRVLGIRSVMAEGGARVIQSFLATPNSVNTVIVTIAPIFVGVEGVDYKLNPTTSQVRIFPSL